jgi:hypothetical protein
MAVNNDFFKEAIMLVLGKPFLDSIMFTGKAGAYPSETPFRCPPLG